MRDLDFPASLAYRRRRALGHNVGCCCEECFVYIERTLQHLIPGFLPHDPLINRLRDMEMENAELRALNERLLRNQAAAPKPNYSPRLHAQDRPSAAFEPVAND